MLGRVLCVGLLAAIASQASAQTQQDFFFLQDRVTRLEQTLGGGGADPQSAAALAIRIDQLEEQVRVLRGQADEANFRAQQLEEQLRRFQEDVEFRFRELQGGGITAIPDDTPLQPAPIDPGTLAGGLAPGGQSLGGQSPGEQILGTLSIDPGASDPIGAIASRPLDLGVLSGTNSAQPIEQSGDQLALAVQRDPRSEFELGYSLFITGDYQTAEQVFLDVIASFPGDPVVSEATYWAGETYFARGQFREAADRFLTTYTEFASSDEAAPGLLKLALSLDALGETDAACQTIGELRSKFGTSRPDLVERGNLEAGRLGC